MRYKTLHEHKMKGFTLIEVMISMALGLMVMASLFTMFSSQSAMYKEQGTHVVAGQDAEFMISFIAEDLRSAVVSPKGSVADPYTTGVVVADTVYAGVTRTTGLAFDVWVADLSTSDAYLPIVNDAGASLLSRAKRSYVLIRSDNTNVCRATDVQYTGLDYCLRYDLENRFGVDLTANPTSEILEGITLFRVFNDTDTTLATRALYTNMPPPLPRLNVGGVGAKNTLLSRFSIGSVTVEMHDAAVGSASSYVDGYTILLEVAVEAGSKDVKIYNALGVDVSTLESPPRKRIIRYMQVYPMSMVP